jgi:hypothetical protein
MARFGDLARIEGHARTVTVTLKSGAVFVLDRLEASDFDDGLRVWDTERGVVDLGPRSLRSVELRPTPGPGTDPQRLHGTVRTAQGDFAGFLEWNGTQCLGSDRLGGEGAEGPVSLRFDAIRSLARRSLDGTQVTLLDGRQVALSGRPEVGRGHRGIHVDDPRHGRVLVSWEAFVRVDLYPGGGGPA